MIAVLQHGRHMAAAPTRASVGQGDSPAGAGIRTTRANTSTGPGLGQPRALDAATPWRQPAEGLGYKAMAEIVLRVRLIGGEHLDVTYEEDGGTPDEVVDQVISTLAEDNGLLRCRHGGRLIVLYGRGVAALEVAPRGAVL